MPANPRFRPACRAVAVLLAASLVSGCSSWRTVKEPPATIAAAQKQPMHVRVTMVDGRQFEMWDAVVAGDSLIGAGKSLEKLPWNATDRERAARRSASPVRTALALADIGTLKRQETDITKTVLVLTGFGLVILFFVSASSMNLPSGGSSALSP